MPPRSGGARSSVAPMTSQARSHGRLDRRHHRPARRIDLSHHLVARRTAAAPAKATMCCATRAGSSSTNRSRSTSSPAASDGEAAASVPRLRRRARRFRCRREGAARHEPEAFEARHGSGEFWQRLARPRNFYGDLPQMPDAQILFEAVKHLKPTILTGLPLGNWAAPQKDRWAARAFSRRADHHHAWPATSICTWTRATCWSTTAQNHRHLWEHAGGIFVHHKNARTAPPAGGDLPVSEVEALKPRRRPRRRPSRPTPARTPARGSTSPAQSRRSR